MRRVSHTERRARLTTRHHLAPSAKATDVAALAEQLVGLHATDPAIWLGGTNVVPRFPTPLYDKLRA